MTWRTRHGKSTLTPIDCIVIFCVASAERRPSNLKKRAITEENGAIAEEIRAIPQPTRAIYPSTRAVLPSTRATNKERVANIAKSGAGP